MRFMLKRTLFFLFVSCVYSHGQTFDPSVQSASDSISYDSSAQNSVLSSTAQHLLSDTSKSTPAAQNQPQKLTLIKRKYNSRQQVLLATGMMIFVIGIMTLAQQWNP
jgi:hypothetical protein